MSEGRQAFGSCVLDPQRRELSRDGRVVALQSRVFDLLSYLLEHRERVVGKDELMDAVWPGRVITEAALTRAVMKARKAVGDDATRQDIIRTVHGHGYRFVADARASVDPEPDVPARTPGAEALDASGATRQRAASETGPSEPAAAAPTRAHRKEGPWRWGLPALLLSMLALLVWAWAPWRSEVTAHGAFRLAVLPVLDHSESPDLGWMRLGLMSFVNGMLAEAPEIATVGDANVLNLAEREDWRGPLQGAPTQRLSEELQAVHGASHVLVMELAADGAPWRMNWALHADSERPRLGTMVGDDATELARGVVQAVYGELLGRSHLATDVDIVSADPFHNEAYSRGMALSLEGRCADAEGYFRVIMDAEPRLFAPRHALADCLRILGRNDEAEPLLRVLVDEQRAAGPSRNLAESLLTLGILLNRTGEVEGAGPVLEEALAVAQALDEHDLEGAVLHNLAILSEDRNDWAGSEALLDRAVLAYRRAGHEVLPGEVHSLRANLAMDQGRLAEGNDHLEHAVAAFRALGDRRNEAMMLNNLGYQRREQGRLDEAEQFHRQSLAIREDIGDRVGVGRIHGMIAAVQAARGDAEGALASAAIARDIAADTGDKLFEAIALARIGSAQRSLGDAEASRAAYQESRAMFSAIDDEMRALQVELRLAELDLDAGDADRAAETAARVLGRARSRKLAQAELDAMELLGDAALAAGETEQAALEWDAALDRVRETGWVAKEEGLLCKLANLHLDAGDLSAAEPLVGALAALDATPASLGVRARHAWSSGDAAIAAGLLEQARDLAGPAWSAEDQAMLERYRGGSP